MDAKEVLSLIISFLAACIALYAILHKDNKENYQDDRNIAVKIAEQSITLSQILQNISEMRLEQRGMNIKIDDLFQRVVKNEESTKAAHRRIDTLEVHENK